MKHAGVYLDYNATTPPDPALRSQLDFWWDSWGNPSSIHQFGRGPKKVLRESRRSIAKALNIHPLEIIFAGSGSEANNLAIQGLLQSLRKAGSARKTLMMSAIEHPSVRNTLQAMASEGYKVIEVPVDLSGKLDMNFYRAHLSEDVALVTAMIANNEVGVKLPLEAMVSLAHEKGAYFHADCVQALGKMEFDLPSLGVDMATMSSHKIYALKGAGLLYVKKGTPLEPIVHGGAQERGRRAGTENLLAIASLAFMVSRLGEENYEEKIRMLRDHMENEIQKNIEGTQMVAGGSVPRLTNTSCITIDGVDGEALMMNLDIRGFAVSTGAACSSGNPEPSPVLLAMGLTRAQAQSSLRVSLGRDTTMENVNAFVETLGAVVKHLRDIAKNDGEVLHGAV